MITTHKISTRNYLPTDYEHIKLNLKAAHMFDKIWDSRKNLEIMTRINPWAILVAEVDGEFAGNVFILYSGWEADLYRMAVLEKFRKLGVATRLLEAAEAKLRRVGVSEYALFAESENQTLIDFYLKRGFNRYPKSFALMWKGLR